jgi:hypothetical protein
MENVALALDEKRLLGTEKMIRSWFQRRKNQLGVGLLGLQDPTREPRWWERLLDLLPPDGH